MPSPISTLNRASCRSVSLEEPITPINRAPWFAILLMVGASFFSGNVIIPFVPFLVLELFPQLEKTQVGTRTGLLDGAYFMGVVIGGPIWGRLADVVGRRFALLWGVFAATVFSVAFGFCDNYFLALGIRFAWGMSGANMTICRTLLAEISDHTNRARTFSALNLGIIMGRLLGNGLGGLLSEPAQKYSCLNIKFFRDYPFALPVFVASFLNLASLIAGFMYLPETKEKGPNTEVLKALLLSPTTQANQIKRSSICDILWRSKSLALLFSTCFVSLTHAIYTVIFTLWVLNDKNDYGFNFGSTAIGMARVLAVPTDLLLQLLLFPWAVRKFSLFSCYQTCALLWAVAAIVTPFASYANRSHVVVQWVVLELCVIINNILASVTLSGGGILCTNLIEKEIRGQFLGIRQSFIGVGRGLGACFGGIVFSWSLQVDDRRGILSRFPFNFYLTWLIQSLLMFGVLTLSCFLGGGQDLERTPEEWRDYERRKSLASENGIGCNDNVAHRRTS